MQIELYDNDASTQPHDNSVVMVPHDQIEQSIARTLIRGEKTRFAQKSNLPLSDKKINNRYGRNGAPIRWRITYESVRDIPTIFTWRGFNEFSDPQIIHRIVPVYRRRFEWSPQYKSRLIESLLLSLPVPPVLFYECAPHNSEVLDGRQRLNTICDFYANKFELIGMECLPQINNCTYATLPVEWKMSLNEQQMLFMRVIYNEFISEKFAAALKKIIFERFNNGGIELSNQEIRNVVYPGSFNTLCISLSENPNFRRMWNIPIDPLPQKFNTSNGLPEPEPADEIVLAGNRMFRKMEDVELVLRFFAYRQMGEFKVSLNEISNFLDIFIERGNQFSQELLNDYQAIFESTVYFLWNTLGADAFIMLNSRIPSKVVYDSLMFVASNTDIVPYHSRLIEQKAILRDELFAAYSTKHELFSEYRVTITDIEERNHCIFDVFTTVITKIKKLSN
jgi:hypothetical protein